MPCKFDPYVPRPIFIFLALTNKNQGILRGEGRGGEKSQTPGMQLVVEVSKMVVFNFSTNQKC